MRRGGMQRWVVRGVVLAVALTLAACQSDSVSPVGPPETSSPSPDASESATPTEPPVDPAVVVEVCGLALAATETTITVFTEQTAIAELAVAQGDNAAMVAAAKQIDQQFASLAETFTKLSQRPIDASLRERLVRTAEALTDMSSEYYLGSTVDTRVKLAEFQAGLAEICATPAPAASTSAG
ncbi:MAG: hypothetical protein IRY85_05420 [Micromonosporaceae bacterium]|nr:hypothetical protein [Micromonosporaceae bacterium]